MDYRAHYNRLILRAKGRVLEGYRERHHVLPRCMGGGNEPENIAELTPEEHYVAHQLLVKMHPSIDRLVHAANMMAKRCTGNKAFGWLRRRNARASAIRLAGKSYITAEGRRRLSEAHKGNKHTLGYRASAETKAKIGAAKKGRKQSPEHLANRTAALRGRLMPPQTPEHKAKISAALMGNRYCAGKVLPASTRQKISSALKGVKKTAATRAHMVAAWQKRREAMKGVIQK
jgi:hypothetical protein